MAHHMKCVLVSRFIYFSILMSFIDTPSGTPDFQVFRSYMPFRLYRKRYVRKAVRRVPKNSKA